MQQLVTAARNAGATQPLVLDGNGWGNDLTGWAAHEPSDPLHALVAGWHVYDYSGCAQSCWEAGAAPLSRQVPVLLTEVGERDCAHGFLDQLLPWADQHGIGYLGWSWNVADCKGFPALITSYDGTPTAFGEGFKAHLAQLDSATPLPVGSAPTPTPTLSAPVHPPRPAPSLPAMGSPAVVPADVATVLSQISSLFGG
jgi:hypothetical protein